MIVEKLIGPVKIGNTAFRLTIGKPVPPEVLEFWESSNQLKKLIDLGAIKKEKEEKETNKKKESNDKSVRENKSSKPKDSKQGIFDIGDDREPSI